MINIPKNEIKFDPASYVDPNGKVFEWKGEIYRGITSDTAGYFRWLINQNFFQELQRENLVVQTKKTGYYIGGFEVVLKHEKIDPLTYCFEWPPFMLKDAAILIIRLCRELIRHDLILQDAYPWNICFKGAQPIFIDVASIVKARQDMIWEAYQEFCNFFLYPLYLYSANLYDATRFLLVDYLNGISGQVCNNLLPLRYKLFHRGPFFRLTLTMGLANIVRNLRLDNKIRILTEEASSITNMGKIRAKFFNELLKDIESINLPSRKTVWSSYYPETLPYIPSSSWNLKQRAVFEVLNDLKPKEVLDIACNNGWYSILAAKQGARVVSFDTDVNCISELYENAKKERLNVVPLVMDLLNPSPRFGWALRQFPSAIERFKADMCFAFAILHHAVFSQWQDFDRVIESADLFSKRWLLIEFIPKSDEKAQLLLARKNDNFDWYTFENFTRALEGKYRILKIFDSFPAGRKLFLCEK